MTGPSRLGPWLADHTPCHMCGHPKGWHIPAWWPEEMHGCNHGNFTPDSCECTHYQEQT